MRQLVEISPKPEIRLSLKATDDFFDLNETQRSTYSVLGRVLVYLSDYEFSCDEFIFCVAERCPEFAGRNKRKPPFGQDRERRDFVLEALAELDELRELSDRNGPVDKAYVSFAMEQLWYHRNNLTHGKLVKSHRTDQSHRFSLTRWKRDDETRNTFHRETYEYDQALLNSILHNASYLNAMLSEAQRLLSESGAQQQ